VADTKKALEKTIQITDKRNSERKKEKNDCTGTSSKKTCTYSRMTSEQKKI